jgi:hypothetical protein
MDDNDSRTFAHCLLDGCAFAPGGVSRYLFEPVASDYCSPVMVLTLANEWCATAPQNARITVAPTGVVTPEARVADIVQQSGRRCRSCRGPDPTWCRHLRARTSPRDGPLPYAVAGRLLLQAVIVFRSIPCGTFVPVRASPSLTRAITCYRLATRRKRYQSSG